MDRINIQFLPSWSRFTLTLQRPANISALSIHEWRLLKFIKSCIFFLAACYFNFALLVTTENLPPSMKCKVNAGEYHPNDNLINNLQGLIILARVFDTFNQFVIKK